MSAYPVAKNVCAQPRCKESYSKSRHETIAAGHKGWFMQKDGQAWCPKHTPDWVASWRERKANAKNVCAQPRCKESCVKSPDGTISAEWVVQKNGKAWCPKHTPGWAVSQRERKAAK